MAFGGTAAASLYVRIGADLSDFQKGMTEVGKSLQDTGKRMGDVGSSMSKNITAPILAVGAGIAALAIKTGNFADALLDLSATTGISTDKLQQYRKAEVEAGVATDSIADSISRMNRQMTEGGEYATKLSAVAEGLGVALTNTNGAVRDASEVHHELMLSLAEIEDPQERARQGAIAFGRDWANIAPVVDLGREALEKMYETDVISREQLEAANAMRAEMDALKHELSMTFMELGTKLAPLFKDVFIPLIKDTVVPAIEGLVKILSTLAEWFGKLPGPVQKVILAVITLVAAIGPALVIAGKLIGMFGGVMASAASLAPAIAFLTGPIGLAIAAFAAIMAVGVLVIRNWDSIKAAATSLVNSIRQAFSGVVEAITRPFQQAYERVRGIMDNIKNQMNKINPFARQSPSLVDNVKMGVAEIEKAYKSMDIGIDASVAEMSMTQQPRQGLAGVNNSQGVIDYDKLAGAVTRALRGAKFDTNLNTGTVELIVGRTLAREARI